MDERLEMGINTHISTTIRPVNNLHPLRNSIDKWRGRQMSENTWKKVSNTHLRNVENQFVMSGTSIMEDYLQSTPQGQNTIKRIVDDMEMRKEYYFE